MSNRFTIAASSERIKSAKQDITAPTEKQHASTRPISRSHRALVQFIEETPPAEILDRTLDKLRAGVPTQTMLTASALAVTRSTEMPPGHHGGPLHPLAGLYAMSKLVERLEGEQRSSRCCSTWR